MTYDFKKAPELVWIAAVAAGTFLLEVLVRFDPDAIADWRTWAVGIGAGAIRAAAGAVLAYATRPSG